jgi:hypothetical protein
MTPVLRHPSEDSLELYSLGRSRRGNVIERHLIACERCRQKLTGIDQFTHAMISAIRDMVAPRIQNASGT